jgi:hypothetical protein
MAGAIEAKKTINVSVVNKPATHMQVSASVAKLYESKEEPRGAKTTKNAIN